MRNIVVLSAMQASATKWLPGLFLDDEIVEQICLSSAEVQEEVMPMGTLRYSLDAEPDAEGNLSDSGQYADE